MLSYFSIEDEKSRIIGRHSVWRNTVEGGETIGGREINMKEKPKSEPWGLPVIDLQETLVEMKRKDAKSSLASGSFHCCFSFCVCVCVSLLC